MSDTGPTQAERALAAAYCRANGDLAVAATRAGLDIEAARAALRSSWWRAECAGYWAEHPPTVAQAALAARDVMLLPNATPNQVLKASQITMEHTDRERVASTFDDLVGLARNATSDRLIAELFRRNLLRLPPAQLRVAQDQAEMLLAAYAPPAPDDAVDVEYESTDTDGEDGDSCQTTA